MLSQWMDPLNNAIRYEIAVEPVRQHNTIYYKITIYDLAFPRQETLYARFSQIKKFHEKISKSQKGTCCLPEFPKTNSIMFWNRTNKDYKMIDQRKRELEYYLIKLLNQRKLGGLKLLKKQKFQFTNVRKTKSSPDLSTQIKKIRSKSFCLVTNSQKPLYLQKFSKFQEFRSRIF